MLKCRTYKKSKKQEGLGGYFLIKYQGSDNYNQMFYKDYVIDHSSRSLSMSIKENGKKAKT